MIMLFILWPWMDDSIRQLFILLLFSMVSIFICSTKGTWRQVLDNLPDSLHVIAVDLPGHGGTTFTESDGFTAKHMAERVHQLTEKLGMREGAISKRGIPIMFVTWCAFCSSLNVRNLSIPQ